MKNTLGDLNNHLFAQLEKLGDDDLTGEELESELKRTDAICDISEQIIKNGELQYKAICNAFGKYTEKRSDRI